jgi:adenylosuccinate synthase
MKNLVVVGVQWGDEGKGKIVDLLAERFDVIARFGGGHNAGHTVKLGPAKEQKFILQLIPCGILRAGKKAVIGNGLVVDPAALEAEIAALAKGGIDVQGRLFVSNRAHVIFPYHRMMETAASTGSRLGTTSRGIGPTYEDKMGRRGIRMADLLDRDAFHEQVQLAVAEKNSLATSLHHTDLVNADQIEKEYTAFAEMLRPLVVDVAAMLDRELRAGHSLLMEGAQATMLDIDHGTYPYVTSSSTVSGGAAIGLGIAPTAIGSVMGVSKAYCTRVGGGPFVTEQHGPEGEELRKRGNEFGAVTGRPRRCGWFDAMVMRYARMVNGIEHLVITKLDVLDHLAEIPVCTGYRYKGTELTEMPALVRQLEHVEPVYKMMPGWKTSTEGLTAYEQLPPVARDYLRYLEDISEVEICIVSTGPERAQTLWVPGSKMAKAWF